MTATTSEDRRAAVLDGARVAEEIKAEVAAEVARLAAAHGVRPGLAAVRVGADAASAVYVRNKVRTSEALGLHSEHHALPAETTTEELLALVRDLNAREEIDGILVQLPLPPQVAEERVLEAVAPEKDVDGFHPLNVGNLVLGRPCFVPCTPAGIVELLARAGIELRGARACVVGRSHIVGRPLAQLLLQRDATVTIAHSHTPDLAAVTREADVLVAAVGRAGLIRAEHVKPGAVVVDVGMCKVSDEAEARALFGAQAAARVEVIRRRGFTLCGDVNQAEVERVAGWLTPVPGGVGPLTVAMLMRNTVAAARRRRGL
ncbi:MAG TPA: bifunctional 5,10-methylenetetrahydrofolate dehydrogenase/5,10-methenyltetrahydrofolate cyclohydrolase [Pyrinomonadaceae bacterium]|jgi:methylenetetrahydrofolate dehydrogenase (NADP+)/methenyltetrahydrofolate cyclohydrolase